jgi:hypothetical protein
MDSYEQKLTEWKKKQGIPDTIASDEDIPAGELRMLAEHSKATGKSYCWMCADEFPIREMLIETSPYNQMEDAAIEEDGYIAKANRNYRCEPCDKRDRDEEAGIEEGQEPSPGL